MANWFYVRDGQQTGPIDHESFRLLIESGEVTSKDLAWTEGMTDWKPVGSLAEFSRSPEAPPTDPNNPYAAPATTWSVAQVEPGGLIEEIEPGSDPLDAVACISRSWELVKTNFGLIVLTGLVYLGVTWALEIPMALIDVAAGGAKVQRNLDSSGFSNATISYPTPIGVIHQLLSSVLSVFLTLGMTRIGLNIVSGRPASVGMIFGEGQKVLRAIGASILFYLMVGVGFLLLFVPGIYLALRFGQFLPAIVDKDLGVIDSLKYSSRITQNNRGNLLLLWILSFLVVIAGVLALLVGLLAAIPITWLATFVAYRCLQYGRRACSAQFQC